MSLARRSITSVAWNSIANLVSLVVLFVRAVLLARWLPVDTFGVYALANAVIHLSVIAVDFGMSGAFLHRAMETENESEAAAVDFTLRLIFTLIWAVLLVLVAFAFTSGPLRIALLLLTATTGAAQLTQTPKMILARRVVYRRLALLLIADASLTTLVMLWLALQGATLWALLSGSISSTVLMILAMYIWKPVWRPRLAWSPRIVRYFLRFGSRNFLAALLYRALDRVDDLWTGFYLGETSLGFYSRAYNFALYPRKVLAAPIDSVAAGTYAELKTDRLRMSQAFFRINALLVRSGFLLAGLLALIAPEFIRLVLGDKWLPMLAAFRLMLAFTLFDPIKATTSHLFVAVGKPGQLVQMRLAQLAVMVAGLYLLGPRLGITGVALTVDIMLVLGIGLLFWRAREHVDFSIRKMFLVPSLALSAGMLLARSALSLPGVLGSDWRTASVKFVVFTVVYIGALVLLERHQIRVMATTLNRLRSPLIPFWRSFLDDKCIFVLQCGLGGVCASSACGRFRHRAHIWRRSQR